jgi:hypothetical protein
MPAEAQIFQLAPNLAHAQPVRDGGVDIERFLRDFLLAVGRQMFEGSHVMQAVGQLDQHHPNVVHHGQHHFAQILGLLLLAGGKVNFADLGNALDDMSDLLAELLADVDNRDRGILDRVVQQASGHGHRVHFHLGENQGHFERMHQVGFAGSAGLPGVMLLGELIGLANDFEIVARAVLAHHPHQVTELGDREDIGRDLLAQRRHTRL